MPRLFFSIGAGAAVAAGFAPFFAWPVSLIALALFLHLLAGAASRGEALRIGYAFGVGLFVAGNSWIAGAFRYQEDMPVWLGWVGVFVLGLYLAVYPALAAGVAWRFSAARRQGAGFVLLFAALWIITEMLRAKLFTGYAWNPLAAIAVEGAGITRFIGSYGLSGLIVLVAGGLWLGALRQWKPALALAGVPLALGTAAQLMPQPLQSQASAEVIRIVQPNIAQKDKYRPDYERENFTKLATLSGNAGAERRMLFWPEAAVPDFIGEDDYDALRARQRIAALLGKDDMVMLGADKLFKEVRQRGGVVEERWAGAANAVYLLDSRGVITARYDKAHLVPYGEYLPMRDALSAIGLSRLVPGDLDFWPGPGPRTLDPGKGWPRVGVQICYEIIFSGEVVDTRPGKRPDFIFNPSNDAWFASWGPPQHLHQARLRAVEEGLPVIRSTPTGISAIIDAHGRIVDRLPYEQAGVIAGRLPPPAAPTLFSRLGNLLPFGLALLLAAGGVALLRRAR